MALFRVRAIKDSDDDEAPARNTKIVLMCTDFSHLGQIEGWTDSDGVAEFEGGEGNYDVYHHGRKVDSFHFEEGDEYTVDISDT